MSYKSILVTLAPGEQQDAGRDYAISMAIALNAHVKGCVFALEPDFDRNSWLELPAQLIKKHRAELVAEAEKSIKKFQEAAKRAKVEGSQHVYRATLSAAKTSLAQIAGVHDVTVLTQSAKGLEHMGDVLTEAVLFSSGRPLIITPKRWSEAFSAHRVLIAWDGGPQSARAVAMAMPILSLAKEIEVLVVGDKNKAKSSRARELVTNLQRHALNAEFIFREEEDDAGTIARQAKNRRASLLVMGAFGRSRLMEFVFGGVTRYMLSNAQFPVFMAH